MALASAGPFIFMYLQRRAENILLRDQRRYQNTLRQISATLTLIKDLDKLLKLIVLRSARAVKVDFACIYLADDRQSKFIQKYLYTIKGFFLDLPKEIPYNSELISYIKKRNQPLFSEELSPEIKRDFNLVNSLIIPSFLGERFLGFLILGPKSKGIIYTQDDINVFGILANQLALAIENTQFLKEFEELQAKLRQAEKLEGIAQMMSSLNHELKNIFNKISLPIQLILIGDIDINNKEEVEENLKRINKAVELGNEILNYVNSYRDKSKSERIEYKSLSDVLDKVITSFKERFKEANIKCIKNIPSDLPLIQAKETFDELFINVLANSYFSLIDKPENEERLIEIDAFLFNDKIEIKIADTGRDITKTGYSVIKESLFKERAKVGGINLFLAYLITHEHKGKLTLEPNEKGGTTFIIDIPLNQEGEGVRELISD